MEASPSWPPLPPSFVLGAPRISSSQESGAMSVSPAREVAVGALSSAVVDLQVRSRRPIDRLNISRPQCVDRTGCKIGVPVDQELERGPWPCSRLHENLRHPLDAGEHNPPTSLERTARDQLKLWH